MILIRVLAILMFIGNAVLLVLGCVATYGVFFNGRSNPDYTVLFLTVPALISIVGNVYLALSMSAPRVRQTEYIEIPLPNPKVNKWKRSMRGLGLVNILYGVGLLALSGYFLYEITDSYYGSDDLLLYALATVPLLFGLLQIIHVMLVWRHANKL